MRFAGLILAAILTACAGDAPPPQSIKERVSGDFIPTPEERTVIFGRVYAYWDALARRDWRQAYEFHTEDFRERVPFRTWRQRPGVDWRAYPKPVSIHWSKGAHRHQGPELYAIIEWTSGADTGRRTGRLIWRKDYDSVFRIEN